MMKMTYFIAWSSCASFLFIAAVAMSDGGWKMREHHLAFTDGFTT